MAATTKIAWTDATWNPVTGCTKCSAGCLNCYAAKMTKRLQAMKKPKYQAGFEKVVCHTEALNEPFRWKKPRMIFVNSMADTFHESVPIKFLDKMFAVMASTREHTYQILTKRPTLMAEWYARVERRGPLHANLYQSGLIDFYQRHDVDLSLPYQVPTLPTPELRFIYDSARGIDPYAKHENREDRDCTRLHKHDVDYHWRDWPLSNVWLGTTAENQDCANVRIDELLKCKARVRFLSLEPLLEPINIRHWIDRLDWVIVGCESGPGAREMKLHWVREIRDQCLCAGVPFFFKQKYENGKKILCPQLDGWRWKEMPEKGGGSCTTAS
ncbi:MAG TPA: phage Gp37/Gp68 family protein [Phycisphaerae bacterium]|nr:phage Gp37/Gp68 family protein [Phycisphaerae bacterium]